MLWLQLITSVSNLQQHRDGDEMFSRVGDRGGSFWRSRLVLVKRSKQYGMGGETDSYSINVLSKNLP